MLDGYLTIKQVSDLYKKKTYQIRYAIKTGKLKYIKPNWEIFIEKDSIPNDWKKRKE